MIILSGVNLLCHGEAEGEDGSRSLSHSRKSQQAQYIDLRIIGAC